MTWPPLTGAVSEAAAQPEDYKLAVYIYGKCSMLDKSVSAAGGADPITLPYQHIIEAGGVVRCQSAEDFAVLVSGFHAMRPAKSAGK